MIKHLILPAIALGSIPLAIIARITRASVLDVQNEDYVRTARAKGVDPRTVDTRHILRNAMLPIVTIIGLQMGLLLSGAVLTETVFAFPGIGTLAPRRDQGPQLPRASGRDPLHRVRLRAGQPDRRPLLRVPQPADPPLMSIAEIEAREIGLEPPAGGLWSDAWARLRRNPGAMVGFALVGFFVTCAIFAPLLAPEDPASPAISRGSPGAAARARRPTTGSGSTSRGATSSRGSSTARATRS